MQTILSETATVLYHISKDNLARLFKLAATQGHALLSTTNTAMKQAVYEKWNNRIEHLNLSQELRAITEFIQSLSESEKYVDLSIPISYSIKV